MPDEKEIDLLAALKTAVSYAKLCAELERVKVEWDRIERFANERHTFAIRLTKRIQEFHARAEKDERELKAARAVIEAAAQVYKGNASPPYLERHLKAYLAKYGESRDERR